MNGTRRLDAEIVSRGLISSRERAREAIRLGLVQVAGRPARKPAEPVTPGTEIHVEADPVGYVSRGGLKLEAALSAFALDVAGLTCLDIGASTGGFTECLLRNGAARIYAVDVGRGQLHAQLRAEPRVVSLESTDIRTLADLPVAPRLATIDVSFISLRLVLPALPGLLTPEADVVALVKPQFEVGRGRLGKGGIVRDGALREEAVAAVCGAARELGLALRDRIPSPILGADGNHEVLLHFRRDSGETQPRQIDQTPPQPAG